MSIYLDLFKSNYDIIREYSAPADALDGAEILLAIYEYQDYEGYSFVLYKKDGKLFEVNGSHCSCNGLEGQWEPEETSWAALAKRKYYGSTEIQNYIGKLSAEHVTPEAN